MKQAAFLVLVTVAAVIGSEQHTQQQQQQQQQPQHQQQRQTQNQLTWTEVIECYKSPSSTAVECLKSRMSRALTSWRETAVSMARSDPDVAAEDATGVGDLIQQIGEFITYGLTSYFHGDDNETAVASAGGSSVNGQKDLDEGRGHHKKKKIQKEIKKFVLKILFGIYLIKQKIKMILMSIQSILMSKFLVVAMIYALSNTFKIWHDIKQSKHHGHGHDKVVYYENAHHQHHYEPPEHNEYDDHHHGWGDWGRSITVTDPSMVEEAVGPMGPHGMSRFIRRVSRTAQPAVTEQIMAFNAQRPRQ